MFEFDLGRTGEDTCWVFGAPQGQGQLCVMETAKDMAFRYLSDNDYALNRGYFVQLPARRGDNPAIEPTPRQDKTSFRCIER